MVLLHFAGYLVTETLPLLLYLKKGTIVDGDFSQGVSLQRIGLPVKLNQNGTGQHDEEHANDASCYSGGWFNEAS
jgi:hypothetical protein